MSQELPTLGLWADGDEVFAIEDAFAAIGLEVPVEDASTWSTVGDLWGSVEKVAPEMAAADNRWDAFRKALADETSVDWRNIQSGTTLLDGRGHNVLSRMWTSVRERLAKNV